MMMQGSLFYKASCYAMLESKDPAKEKAYKQMAIRSLVQLTTDYPKSKFAPSALSQMAALYAAAGDLAETERTIRKLMDEADPIFHPDGMEGFNPTTAGTALRRWSRRAPALAEELGIAATGGSDAHRSENVGTTQTLVRRTGTVEESLRRALAERDTRWQGDVYSWRSQLSMFTLQTRKNLAALGG